MGVDDSVQVVWERNRQRLEDEFKTTGSTKLPEWFHEEVQKEQLRRRPRDSGMDPDDPGVFPASGRNRQNSGLGGQITD